MPTKTQSPVLADEAPATISIPLDHGDGNPVWRVIPLDEAMDSLGCGLLLRVASADVDAVMREARRRFGPSVWWPIAYDCGTYSSVALYGPPSSDSRRWDAAYDAWCRAREEAR